MYLIFKYYIDRIRIGIIGLLVILLAPTGIRSKVSSPDGNLVLELQLKKGQLSHQLSHKGKTIIESSRLGLEMEEALSVNLHKQM